MLTLCCCFFAQQKEWCIYAQTNTQFACIFCVFFNKRTVQRKPGDLQDKRRVCQSISIDHIVCIMHKKAERRQLMAVSKLCHLTKTYFFNIQSNNLKKEEKFNTQSGLNMIVSYDIIYYHVYMIIWVYDNPIGEQVCNKQWIQRVLSEKRTKKLKSKHVGTRTRHC